jgi:hypothetical protein
MIPISLGYLVSDSDLFDATMIQARALQIPRARLIVAIIAELSSKQLQARYE